MGVGIDISENVAAGGQEAALAGPGDPLFRLEHIGHRRITLHHRPRAVGAVIVDDDDLERLARNIGHHRIEAGAKIGLFVKGRDDEADRRPLCRGRGGHCVALCRNIDLVARVETPGERP